MITERIAILTFACAMAACSSSPPASFKGCATPTVKAGDKMKANGQDVTVLKVIGPYSNCTVDRPIEAEVTSLPR